MIDFLKNGLFFAVAATATVTLLALLTQLHVARDRKSRTGQGWDARDTFEIKDALAGAAVYLAPMGFMIEFMTAKPNLPDWQWWAIVAAFIAIGVPFSMWQGRWSIAQRKAFENAAADKRTTTGTS